MLKSQGKAGPSQGKDICGDKNEIEQLEKYEARHIG